MWLGQYKNIFSTYLTLYTLYTHFLELQFFLIMFESAALPKGGCTHLTLPHDITCTHVSGLISYHRSTEDCPITGFFLLWPCLQPQMHVFLFGVPDYSRVASLPFGIFPPDDSAGATGPLSQYHGNDPHFHFYKAHVFDKVGPVSERSSLYHFTIFLMHSTLLSIVSV